MDFRSAKSPSYSLSNSFISASDNLRSLYLSDERFSKEKLSSLGAVALPDVTKLVVDEDEDDNDAVAAAADDDDDLKAK